MLFEQFELGKLLGRGTFEDWGEEEALALMREAERYAMEVAGPLNAVGDRQGCEIVDGGVKTPEGFASAYRQLYEGGFKSVVVPVEFGGAAGPKSLSLVVNELTSGPNAALDMYGGLTAGAADVVYEFGSDDQHQRYCQKLFTGSWAGTMCLTEPQAGSDVGESTTSATPLGEGKYAIKGTKIFISGGDQDITENVVHMVLARVTGAPKGTRGLSLFIVPKLREDGSSNDVKVSKVEHKMGLNGSATCVLNFGDEGGCVGELVGNQEGQGMRQMFKMMNFARIGVGVQGLACASTAYLNALCYARERKQGPSIDAGKDPYAPRVPIVQHPDIRRLLLEMKSKVEGTRAMIIKAGWHADAARQTDDRAEQAYHQGQIELLTPLIKAYASDQAFQIAAMAVQICGGAGYTADYPVEQYCRDAKVFAIYEGTNHIQALDLVGRKLGLQGGSHARAFFKDVKTFAAAHTQHATLGPSAVALNGAADALAKLALTFGGWETKGQLARVALVASPFLELLSELCISWLSLQAGVIASGKLEGLAEDHPDHAFYTGKLAAAQYLARWVLPTIAGRVQVLLEAPDTALTLPDAAFATV